MAITLKYQGRQSQNSRTEKTYKQTWTGTETEIDAKVQQLSIGTFVDGKGYLDNYRKHQGEGIFWELQVEYKTTTSNDNPNDDGTVVGKKSATLSVRNIQMPLQHLPNYRKHWNHYLVADRDNTFTPDFWSTADYNSKNEGTEVGVKFRWIKQIQEMRTQPDSNGKREYQLKKPTKPGVQYYDLACFVVNINAKYNTASAAGNAISKNINKISTPEQTFGLTGGNWKLDQCSVSYDGKYWIANMTYTKSGDNKGWDTDIYS